MYWPGCHCSGTTPLCVNKDFALVLLVEAHCVEQVHLEGWGEVKVGTSSDSPAAFIYRVYYLLRTSYSGINESSNSDYLLFIKPPKSETELTLELL